jgi:hypothetical protein
VNGAGLGFQGSYVSDVSYSNWMGTGIDLNYAYSDHLPSIGSCTGLGAGTCSIVGGSQAFAGAVLLAPSGSSSFSGMVTLKLNFTASHFWICSLSPIGGSASWPISTITQVQGANASVTNWHWSTGGVRLERGRTYAIAYNCKAI